MVEPSSGVLLVGGEDVRGQPPARLRRGIGYVVQQAGLFPQRTVLATLRAAAGLYQTDVARAVPCHRTTVTHAEAGSQLPDSDFWKVADRVVGANGALLARYDAFIQAREAHKSDPRSRPELSGRLVAS